MINMVLPKGHKGRGSGLYYTNGYTNPLRTVVDNEELTGQTFARFAGILNNQEQQQTTTRLLALP